MQEQAAACSEWVLSYRFKETRDGMFINKFNMH